MSYSGFVFENNDGVALDTGIENRAARSLYEHSGFSPSSLRPAPDARTAHARAAGAGQGRAGRVEGTLERVP